ncbi:hypothetical protein QOZ80_9AG0690200 [Eleusine coracana subsp. coracana]|nr:hypothetical protein QOZ80_9AG0690200 [Eleusine coracana subsp. coracana]
MASSSSTLQVLRGVYQTATRSFPSNSSSLSSTIGRMVTGRQLLRIEQYPFLEKKVVAGKAITSAAFIVAGKERLFHYYPNGADSSTGSMACAGHELSTRNPLPCDAVAEYEVSIVGRNGKPAWGYSISLGLRHFNYITTYQVRLPLFRWLAPCFLDVDGCLNVQCKVTAVELDTEPYKN